MINHSQAFNYFGNRLNEFKDKFGFNFLEINPCEIKNKEDLIFLVNKAVDEFLEEEFVIIDQKQEASNEEIRIDFICNNQEHSLKIDSKSGFINLDYSETFKFIGLLSGKTVSRINPSAELVVGDEEEIKIAWNQGFPIHLFNPIFLHKNITGKKFKRDEIRSEFRLSKTIKIDEYGQKLVNSLNKYLLDNKENFRFNKNQIKVYLNKQNSYRIMLSGDYCGEITIKDNCTYFKNNFLNQTYLFYNWSMKEDLYHIYENGKQIKVLKPFNEYVSLLGDYIK